MNAGVSFIGSKRLDIFKLLVIGFISSLIPFLMLHERAYKSLLRSLSIVYCKRGRPLRKCFLVCPQTQKRS